MSFALPPPGTTASSSIWERRKVTKSSSTSDAEVELNVLSLLLDASIECDEEDFASPASMHSPAQFSPWMQQSHTAAGFRPASPSFFSNPVASPSIHRSRSLDQAYFETLEMHTAQLAVKAALDVLDEPAPATLRISTSNKLGLSAPASPALSSPASPVSPAESCFSESGEVKKKGRARMSQEKRKRLARRREREALVAAITEQPMARSAPATPSCYFPSGWGDGVFSTPMSSPRSFDLPPSPALTHGRASSATPNSSPVYPSMPIKAELTSSPPTLVVQPPSPQRVRSKDVRCMQNWNAAMHSYASVF